MTELDPAVLRARLEQLVADRRPDARVRDITRMPAGVSSLAYLVTLDGSDASLPDRLVLKVAPVGLAPTHNRDVLRQARVMSAVAEHSEVPVPRIILTDDGLPPLFAMECLSGESYEPGTDIAQGRAPDGDTVGRRFAAATRALMALQRVPPTQLMTADEPNVTPRDELERWARLFETVDDDICPNQRSLRTRLSQRVPDQIGSVLAHGDYRLANMLFVDSDLQGVIDWEIWSRADPRHDLAWLLMHVDPPHRFHRLRPDADLAAAEALPPRDQVLEWAGLAGADVSALTQDLPWFLALSAYKVASTVGVLAKRNRRLEEPAERLVVAQESLADVIAAGHAHLDGHGA